MAILEQISSREDLLRLTDQQQVQLCGEIRTFLIKHVSKTGGHLASNLGVVELTLALHRVFDLSYDRLVFDVGHQAYVHKILSGRWRQFDTLRQIDGLSGFPKPYESIQDAFIAGHASNSVSVALGMARAAELQHAHYESIALIGDGALTGGMAYEGLDDAGRSGNHLIVVLNDNEMSISPSVGAVAAHLQRLRLKPQYFRIKKLYRELTQHIPGGRQLYRFTHYLKLKLKHALIGTTLFEEMGFTYLGPVDGHDLKKVTYNLMRAKEERGPVLVHVLTQKGKGYAAAEHDPDIFHGVGTFDPAKDFLPAQKNGASFSSAFGAKLVELARHDDRVCAITAAMPQGTGLSVFAEAFPRRFFDVGIAEGHAVAMAAGMAKQGLIPVVAVYSTFLQRAYDQLLHDIALLNLHVVFGVDRAGLVGQDGETHNGVFDVGFLRQVPGMTVLCPASQAELARMLYRAVEELDGPVAVRYPRGGDGDYEGVSTQPVFREGADLTLVVYGPSINQAIAAAEQLQKRAVSVEIIKLDCIKPLDMTAITASARKTGHVVVQESCVAAGCVGQEIAARLTGEPCRVVLRNLGDHFTPQGRVGQLLRREGLDADSLAAAILEELK